MYYFRDRKGKILPYGMILTRLFKTLKANMTDYPFDERYIRVPRKMSSLKAKQPKKHPPKRTRNVGKSKRAQLTTSSSSDSPPSDNGDLPSIKLFPRSYSRALLIRKDMSDDQREIRGMFKNLARALHKFAKMLKKGTDMKADDASVQVIQNGKQHERTGRDRNGRVIILPSTTADEHIAVQRESKARTTLLQSIPDDHVVDFHYMDDARDIWNAVKARMSCQEYTNLITGADTTEVQYSSRMLGEFCSSYGIHIESEAEIDPLWDTTKKPNYCSGFTYFSCNSSDKNENPVPRTTCNKNWYSYSSYKGTTTVPIGKQRCLQPSFTGRQNRPYPVSTDRGKFSISNLLMYYNHMKYGGVRWATAVKPSADNPYSDADMT
ncbi:hypothetical protein Tco_0775724 [Tanacetum coccineum]